MENMNMTKQEIAMQYVNLHKINNLDEWMANHPEGKDEKLERIYYDLIGGAYGYVQEFVKIDGNFVDIPEDFYDAEEQADTIGQIEISESESRSGKPELFEFPIAGNKK